LIKRQLIIWMSIKIANTNSSKSRASRDSKLAGFSIYTWGLNLVIQKEENGNPVVQNINLYVRNREFLLNHLKVIIMGI